jgi:hypothetical protein
MLLTDDEIYGMYSEPSSDAEMVAFARAIEAAILAKLGAMELPPLPEPSEMDGARWGYTSDDMQNHAIDVHAQGFAQGAAAQLAERPSAKQFQTPDGKWHSFLDLQHEEHTVNDGRWPIRELYTRREAK